MSFLPLACLLSYLSFQHGILQPAEKQSNAIASGPNGPSYDRKSMTSPVSLLWSTICPSFAKRCGALRCSACRQLVHDISPKALEQSGWGPAASDLFFHQCLRWENHLQPRWQCDHKRWFLQRCPQFARPQPVAEVQCLSHDLGFAATRFASAKASCNTGSLGPFLDFWTITKMEQIYKIHNDCHKQRVKWATL